MKNKVKIRKYPGASSSGILDHIKPSLWKAAEQIIIHAGMNDISYDTNYLKNVKKILKLVKKPAKIPNLASPQCFVAPILKILVALLITKILS